VVKIHCAGVSGYADLRSLKLGGTMSYAKAMRHSIRKSRKQANTHFGFSTLAPDERRRHPILGGVWFEPGQEGERTKFIEDWHAKTEEMLAQNPQLKIVD
jgi:hypothetical protein